LTVARLANILGKKNKINARNQRIKKLETDIAFTLYSPLFFLSPQEKFHSPWREPFTRLRSTGSN